jgi:hypothetical protein
VTDRAAKSAAGTETEHRLRRRDPPALCIWDIALCSAANHGNNAIRSSFPG